MAALLIKNVPSLVHRRLKQAAARHHRSMNREALALLEEALRQAAQPFAPGAELPPAFNAGFRLTNAFLNKAKREGRA